MPPWLTALVGATAVVGLAVGCVSPTLPLPPPEEPDALAESAEPGMWDVRGECAPGALVLIKNLDTGVIAGTEDKDGDGRYLIRIEATVCDGAEVTQLLGNDVSGGTFFVVEPLINGMPDGSCPR